jgi:hypothetical protein
MLTIEIIKSKYLERVREKYPDLDSEALKEVWEYVLGYFPYYKERVKTLDFLEYKFLNLGITRTSSTAVRDWLISNKAFLGKYESHPPHVKEKLKYIKANRDKITPDLEQIYQDLQIYVTNGRTKRGKENTLRRRAAREAKLKNDE